jgi:hypothetical protein
MMMQLAKAMIGLEFLSFYSWLIESILTPVAQKIHFWEMLNEVELWQRPAWTSF